MVTNPTALIPRRYHKVCLLTLLYVFCVSSVSSAFVHEIGYNSLTGGKPFTVVIDAGHGGKDPGCVNGHAHEKTITLAIAKKVRDLLEKEHPSIKVHLTREKDHFIPLHERSQMANKWQADLFISIHCNALPKPSQIQGTETYVLGLHRADDNLAVAQRENESILLEDNYKLNYGDFDPHSPEAYILMALYQNAYLDRSIQFADMVEALFRSEGKRVSKGVKQAGFLVLRENAMPSVLIETGFLSHKDESDFLQSKTGQETLARCIAKAIGQYHHAVAQYTENRTKNDSLVSSTAPTKTTSSVKSTAPSASGQWFAIQLGALSRPLPGDHPWRKAFPDIIEKQEGGLYKYMIGPFESSEAAEKERKRLLLSGYERIFAVSYEGERRTAAPQ